MAVTEGIAEGSVVQTSDGEPAEGAQPAEEAPKEPTPAELKQQLEETRAEAKRLAEIAAEGEKRSAASQAYVQQIMQNIQEAAAQVNQRREAAERPDIREAINENPEAVLNHMFDQRMAPVANAYLQSQAELMERLFQDRMKGDEDFEKYKDEVSEFMKGIPMQTKARVGAWEDAFKFVKAQHLEEIVDRRAKKAIEMEKGAFVESPSAVRVAKTGKPTLSADQKAIAKGLQMSETEYIEWMSR